MLIQTQDHLQTSLTILTQYHSSFGEIFAVWFIFVLLLSPFQLKSYQCLHFKILNMKLLYFSHVSSRFFLFSLSPCRRVSSTFLKLSSLFQQMAACYALFQDYATFTNPAITFCFLNVSQEHLKESDSSQKIAFPIFWDG